MPDIEAEERELVVNAVALLSALEPARAKTWRREAHAAERPYHWRYQSGIGWAAVCKFCDEEIVVKRKGAVWSKLHMLAAMHGLQCALVWWSANRHREPRKRKPKAPPKPRAKVKPHKPHRTRLTHVRPEACASCKVHHTGGPCGPCPIPHVCGCYCHGSDRTRRREIRVRRAAIEAVITGGDS